MTEPSTPADLSRTRSEEELDLLRRQVEATERSAAHLQTIRTILLTFFLAAAVVVGLWAAGLAIVTFGS